MAQQEWDTGGLVMEKVAVGGLFAIVQTFTVVGGEQDDHAVPALALSEAPQQPAELPIGVGDFGLVALTPVAMDLLLAGTGRRRRGAANDQLTVWRPGAEGGEISYVQIVEDGSSGAAVIEALA